MSPRLEGTLHARLRVLLGLPMRKLDYAQKSRSASGWMSSADRRAMHRFPERP